MFCPNCGNIVDDNALFCSGCGNSLKSANSVQPPISQKEETSPVTSETKKRKKGKTWGIVLLVLGALSVLGGIGNGSYEQYFTIGMDLADIVTVLVTIGFLGSGIHLVIKNK